MNALVPMLVAVLLSETGRRGAQFAESARFTTTILIMGLAVGASAVGGLLIAPGMTPRARLLLVSIALIFAGAGQFGRLPVASSVPNLWKTALGVSRTGVPLLAFALSAWQSESVGVVAGGVAGFGAAVALSGALGVSHRLRVSQICGTVLLVIGAFVSLSALRLIGR